MVWDGLRRISLGFMDWFDMAVEWLDTCAGAIEDHGKPVIKHLNRQCYDPQPICYTILLLYTTATLGFGDWDSWRSINNCNHGNQIERVCMQTKGEGLGGCVRDQGSGVGSQPSTPQSTSTIVHLIPAYLEFCRGQHHSIFVFLERIVTDAPSRTNGTHTTEYLTANSKFNSGVAGNDCSQTPSCHHDN